MIEGPIKTKAPASAPPGMVQFLYVSPDDKFWNVDHATGKYLQIWTVDSWGTVQTTAIREKEFREKWKERNPSHEQEGENNGV